MNNEKLENAMNNFQFIKNSNNPKFQKIDNWLEKESILYKSEIKAKSRNYMKLKRGTIVKVDFGVNPGSELCHSHFGIVISKNDNCKQETVIVVPLTSKPGVGRLPLNNLIKDEIIRGINKKVSNDGLKKEEIDQLLKITNEYRKYTNFSYAFISQICAVSKSRLQFSTNPFDIINKARCSKEILDQIDKAIINEITGIKMYEISQLETTTIV